MRTKFTVLKSNSLNRRLKDQMHNLSRIINCAEWIMASPATDSRAFDADILVSRAAVRRKHRILRTYVLVNYCNARKIADKNGISHDCKLVIYKKEFSEETKLSRISAIAFFSALYARGKNNILFLYPDQPWEDNREGLSQPLIQFMQNHAPA